MTLIRDKQNTTRPTIALQAASRRKTRRALALSKLLYAYHPKTTEKSAPHANLGTERNARSEPNALEHSQVV